jgi:hypothetical protein
VTLVSASRSRGAREGESILQAAQRHGVDIPHLCYKDGLRAGRQLPRLRGGDRRRARAGAVVLPRAEAPACRCRRRARAPWRRRRWCWSCCVRHAGRSAVRADSELDAWARKMNLGAPRFPRRAQPAADASHPAIAVQPRRLHPVHALPARLPRNAGERRHRLWRRGAARSSSTSMIRWARVLLRRLRRVRAGLPDGALLSGGGFCRPSKRLFQSRRPPFANRKSASTPSAPTAASAAR